MIECLLQERDEMYIAFSHLCENDKEALEKAEAIIREQADKIKQFTDQFAWFRRKPWKFSSGEYPHITDVVFLYFYTPLPEIFIITQFCSPQNIRGFTRPGCVVEA